MKNNIILTASARLGQRLSPEAQAQVASLTQKDLVRFLQDKLLAALRPDAMERMLNRKYGDGSMSPSPRHEDTEMEEPLAANAVREFTVNLADSYNENDGTMNIVSLNVMARSVAEALTAAEAKLASMKAAGAKVVTAAISQKELLDAYARRLKAGRNTGQGAGALFYAKDTGRFLFVKRSDRGDCAGTWGVPGGGVEDYETIEEAVHREADEEVGYNEPYDLIHMHRDVQPDGFTFHNHMAVVPNEFEPQLNDEHTAYIWSEEMPEPMHPRLALSIDAWSQRNRDDNPQA